MGLFCKKALPHSKLFSMQPIDTLFLDILPKEQQKLWPILDQVPNSFTLYGGTAIALQLGHRISIDFDFFSRESIDPDRLYQKIPFLKKSTVIQKSQDTLTCLVPIEDHTVKVSFFGGLDLGQIEYPKHAVDNNLKIASLIDLFGMKCSTVAARIEKKDYIDIDALITIGNQPLSQGLAAAKAIYGSQYTPILTLKALSCFEGGDLGSLEDEIKKRLLQEVELINFDNIPSIQTKHKIGDEEQ